MVVSAQVSVLAVKAVDAVVVETRCSGVGSVIDNRETYAALPGRR